MMYSVINYALLCILTQGSTDTRKAQSFTTGYGDNGRFGVISYAYVHNIGRIIRATANDSRL